MRRSNRLLIASLAGGATASFAMDVVQAGWALAFERNRPVGQLDEETEAIDSVVRLIRRAVPALIAPEHEQLASRVVHYAFGVGIAGAYLASTSGSRPGLTPVWRGVAFGTALWMLSDRILIPAFRFGRPWSRYSVSERTNALASHLAYALVVEGARSAWRC